MAELSRASAVLKNGVYCPEMGEAPCRSPIRSTNPPDTESRRHRNGPPRAKGQAEAQGEGQGVQRCTLTAGLPRKATFTALGLGGHWIDTAVMTPSVPSDPMKSCFRS